MEEVKSTPAVETKPIETKVVETKVEKKVEPKVVKEKVVKEKVAEDTRDKKMCVPPGSIYRMIKTHIELKDKGQSGDVYKSVAKYVNKQVELIANAAADVAEDEGKKTINFAMLKKAGDAMGIEFD